MAEAGDHHAMVRAIDDARPAGGRHRDGGDGREEIDVPRHLPATSPS
jgi:hypothetical protein